MNLEAIAEKIRQQITAEAAQVKDVGVWPIAWTQQVDKVATYMMAGANIAFNEMQAAMKSKSTGAEEITRERNEQIEKHGRTVEWDVENNDCSQLRFAARHLTTEIISSRYIGESRPFGWDGGAWQKMASKSLRDRLIIAGSLLCAEIDRLDATEQQNLAKTAE